MKRLEISMDGKHELVLSPVDYPTSILVGVYPTDNSEMYILTQNGTRISVLLDGKVMIDIPGEIK